MWLENAQHQGLRPPLNGIKVTSCTKLLPIKIYLMSETSLVGHSVADIQHISLYRMKMLAVAAIHNKYIISTHWKVIYRQQPPVVYELNESSRKIFLSFDNRTFYFFQYLTICIDYDRQQPQDVHESNYLATFVNA